MLDIVFVSSRSVNSLIHALPQYDVIEQTLILTHVHMAVDK